MDMPDLRQAQFRVIRARIGGIEACSPSVVFRIDSLWGITVSIQGVQNAVLSSRAWTCALMQGLDWPAALERQFGTVAELAELAISLELRNRRVDALYREL
ncbi:hypothetical protein DV737_g3470, partial [Chaetothyriales sp. CBS 132003]